MIALIALLSLLALLLAISQIGAVSLEATGMTRDIASFQARSALLGVGFTTSEAEEITNHPVRRRIVLYLMTVGNASVITGIGSFLLAFVGTETDQTVRRSLVLIAGIVAIPLIFHTNLAHRSIGRSTRYLLSRYTTVDTKDYAALLRVEASYAITELHASEGDWMVERPLAELHLTQEGVLVLGIHRNDGTFVGAPTGGTIIHPGDEVVTYGRVEVLTELASRPLDRGDLIHGRIAEEHRRMTQEE